MQNLKIVESMLGKLHDSSSQILWKTGTGPE